MINMSKYSYYYIMVVTTYFVVSADLEDKPKSRKGLRWTPERLREKVAAKERMKLATKLLHHVEEKRDTAINDYFLTRGVVNYEIRDELMFRGGCPWCEELRDAGLKCCLHCGTILNTY